MRRPPHLNPIGLPLLALLLLLQGVATADPVDLLGEPLVRASAKSLGMPVKQDYTAAEITAALTRLSKANVAKIAAEVGVLGPEEKALRDKMATLAFPVVHRTKLKRLTDLFEHRRLNTVGDNKNKVLPTFMQAEHQLFGAWGGVFATVGYPSGDIRYGDVALVLDEAKLPAGTWASRWNGAWFLSRHRGVDLTKPYAYVAEHARGYADTIVVKAHWKEYYALLVLQYLRQRSERERQDLLQQLLAAKDVDQFWNLIMHNNLGRLEAKIPGAVPQEWIRQVIVRKVNEAEVRELAKHAPMPFIYH